MLTKEQLLSCGPKRKELHIEELNGSVNIRQLSAREVIDYVKLVQDGKSNEAIAHVIISGVCDENGKAIFNKDDADAVLALGHEVPNTIVDEILRFSKLLADAAEKK